ncbi:hypothetical protein D9756_008794 [Leucocoprinus leucothites]|uniref:Triacylglycerol lipase n=1 Tax=Leucocoprinus leucothites TaxID=201217 RepID=A0A8H5CYU8_9AGAR|nr:hypothetical protein D9756_008794 [Leucoagaricus leucothites]
MISLGLAISLLSFASAFVSATPIHEDITDAAATANIAHLARRATSPLSAAQIASFRPYTVYAAIPGCGPASLLAWNCAKCSSNPEFTPVDAGGDGGLVQIWYVGYDAALDTVIVSFEGTDSQKIIPVIINADIILTPLDSTRFPGISSDIQTHNGFAIAQSLSAAPVLSAVKTTMSRFNTSHVTVVGNSLGAAIATISSIHLKLNLPSTTTFKLVAYGSPRVGNQAFADYVDAHFPGAVSRIVNNQFALEANHRNVNGMNPLRATSYIGLVTYTWDWVSNLTVEYEFLWKYPLCDISAAQALYLATRYSPFLCHAGHLAIINITEKHLPTIPEQLCRYWFFYSLVTVGWSYELLLMNLMLRVYALYQRDWKIMLLFFFLTFVKTANIVVSWFLFIPAFTYTPSCMPLVKAPIGWMALSATRGAGGACIPYAIAKFTYREYDEAKASRQFYLWNEAGRSGLLVCAFTLLCSVHFYPVTLAKIANCLPSYNIPTCHFFHFHSGALPSSPITYPVSSTHARFSAVVSSYKFSDGYLSFELDVHDSVWDAPTYEPEQDMAELANAERMGT